METELHYNRHRYYDAEVGRYLSKDRPINKNMKKILHQLLRFSLGNLSSDSFQSWLYSAKELDKIIDEDLYFLLISANYHDGSQCFSTRKIAAQAAEKLDATFFNLELDSVIKNLRLSIFLAFKDVSRLGGISLHQANVLDCRGSIEEIKEAEKLDVDLNWKEIPNNIIEEHPDSLNFLDNIGFKYYIPACLLFVLLDIKNEIPNRDLVAWNVFLSLCPDSDRKLERINFLSISQKKTIANFLCLMNAVGHKEFDLGQDDEDLAKYWTQFIA